VRGGLAALTLLLASRAFAHDFWIEPSTFRPANGELVTVGLRVGQKLKGEPVPRIPPLIDRFVVRGAGDEDDIIGRAGGDPAGYARISEGGLHWIGYQSNPSPITLEAKKFEDYLREEGLERIVAARAKSGQSAAPGRERFYRCAKALLDTPGPAAVLETPLGFTLELLPRKNPYALKGDLPLSLLFRGKPAAGVLVVAMNRDDPAKAVRARTDSKGNVRLKLPRPGFWLIKAVRMEAAPAGSGVDWESWWASMTFELPSIVSR
jgi:hypothetical protein